MVSFNDLLNGLANVPSTQSTSASEPATLSNQIDQTSQPAQPAQPIKINNQHNDIKPNGNQPNDNQPADKVADKAAESQLNSLLNAPSAAIQTAEIYAADLTQMANFEDSIEYMERIDAMPSLEEIINLWNNDAFNEEQKLNDEQRDLLATVRNTLSKLADSIDLKEIDISVMGIMERLQENPEIINAMRPDSLRILINCFDRLYTIKSTTAAARKEKAASRKSAKATQASFLADINNLELELDL